MTDEEMAEEYENAQDYCSLLDVLLEEQYNQDYGGLSCYISPYIERAFLAGLKAGRPNWHKLDWEKDFPDVDKLIRVRTRSGTEHICETYSYEPSEDEIGYGHCITQFSELNGDWIDDNEVKYWCEIEPFKE
jgi:hypothetical protein